VTHKPVTADQVWVRRKNRSIILDCLRVNNTLSRAGLAAETGLNPSTVSNIITELIQEGLVRETELLPSANGRPGRLLELSPGGGCAIGLEINVDYITSVLTDFRANVLWRTRIRSNPDEPQQVILENAGRLIEQGLSAGQVQGLRPLGIGVGLPGLVDLHTGQLKLAPNLKWREVPMRQILADWFTLPVYVENEANAAALGEYYFGVARGIENTIYLSAGIGLGAGVMIGGKLFRGSRGYASEVGHMTIQPDGELCACGKRGCWETLVGPRAVVRRVQHSLQAGVQTMMGAIAGGDFRGITFEIVVQAAAAGDPPALSALDQVGRNLGLGMANLVNIFNPELIVLGGALNLASPYLLPAIQQAICEAALGPAREYVRIVPSAHGTDACVMGAIALVLDDILREQERGV
jgi:glucokinase-like ROK family protein